MAHRIAGVGFCYMEMVLCPHCRKHRMVTNQIPKDVVVVLPCPGCLEISVVFRNRIMGLSRHIIERGSFEERKLHIAHVVAKFLEAGVLPQAIAGDASLFLEREFEEQRRDAALFAPPRAANPITQHEVDKFVRVDLKCLDNGAYFRKHFYEE